MTLLELQHRICDILNADEILVQGGCRAFAEDAQTVITDVAVHLQQAGGIAVVVTTPSGTMAGMLDGGLQITVDSLTVNFIEVPELNRLRDGNLTSLQAAQHVILRMNQPGIEFQSFSQTSDPQTGTVTTACVFSTQVTLTDGDW